MKITLTNENRYELNLNKYELLLICASDNKELSPEYQYDLDEILDDEREEYTIRERDLDETDDGFIMWSDTFWETIRECDTGECDPHELEIPVTFNICTDGCRFNGMTFGFRRFTSDDLCPNTYTPWEIYIQTGNENFRLSITFSTIEDAKEYAKKESEDLRYDAYRRNDLPDVYEYTLI